MTRVRRVLAPNPGPYTLEGTNTWVVGEEPALVIDPGPEDREHLAEVLRSAGTIGGILLTHRHPDHAPGAALLAELAAAPVWSARPAGAEHGLEPGGEVEGSDVVLRAIGTPGHTPDHLAFLEPRRGWLFTGDAVLGRGTSVIDPPEGDLRAYLRSLEAMLALSPTALYPGHGPVVPDAPGKLREYLAHRAERERQVLGALELGPRTPGEVASSIYAGYSPELRAAAARSVLAHLLKLEDEGRVLRAGRPDGDRFVLPG